MAISLRAFLVSLACLSFVGCGGGGANDLKVAPATGTVTYKGSPLAGATVTFFPDKGPLAVGVTDLKGEFKLNSGALPGCAIGKATVAVAAMPPDTGSSTPTTTVAPPKSPEAIAEASKKAVEMQMQAQTAPAKPKSLIPERYNEPTTSLLSFEVTADASKNVFKIDLVD